jgi:CHAT domain-containing protein
MLQVLITAPTVSGTTLSPPTSPPSPIDRTKMTGLVVAEAAPGRGYTPIPNVNDEIRAVKQVFAGAGVEVLHNTGAQATVAGVVSSLQLAEVNVFHLACHGIQSATPLKSCFVLQDGDLTLEDLMKVELPHAVLAFLSACQTAQGDENHPDQAVHLAASMLFCGFRSVIATMW